MIAAGMFSEDQDWELLEGVVTRKMAKGPLHDGAIGVLAELLRPLLPASSTLRIQSAIATPDSEPDPDLAVARGPARTWLARYPGPEDLVLVVEVADRSLATDRLLKARADAVPLEGIASGPASLVLAELFASTT